jgi:hypothetical protein
MNQQHPPDPALVTQTISKSRHHRRELELASLELEALIARMEQENRTRRSKYLVNLPQNL